MPDLQILQYNVHKRKDIMALLVNSPDARNYDILAIQEPWINPFHPATYCPSSSPFIPVFGNQSKRSCLLVNRKLNPNGWEARVSGPDLCSIRIHNYNYARKDRVGKAAGAGVQLPEQESGAYRVEREMAQRARPQGKLARELGDPYAAPKSLSTVEPC
jgi:hypothetical protein